MALSERKWRARLFLGFGLGAVAAGLAACVFVVDCAFDIPVDGGMSPGRPASMRQASAYGAASTSDTIPDDLKKAVVAIEDRRFYEHGAIDPHGIARAFVRDARGGRILEGGSTISQQLARRMLLSPERTLRRKVQEILIAAWLEHQLTKPQILARYLDQAYFGAGAYGPEAASQRYFGKKARDLDLSEAAMLAGLLRAPSRLAPSRNLAAAQARSRLVLEVMTTTGAISKAQADKAEANPAQVKAPAEAKAVAPQRPAKSAWLATARATTPDAAGAKPAESTSTAPKRTAPVQEEISGHAAVVDTSRLTIGGREIRLLGVAPVGGRPARALARHLAHRTVDCVPATDHRFRCSVGGDDLATIIIANGGSEATADAPDDLIDAQHEARVGGRGIWRDR